MSSKVVFAPEPPHQGDFVVFVEDIPSYQKWLDGDKTIALVEFMDSFDIFFTNGQGASGHLERPTKGTLKSTFDTNDADAIIKLILERGKLEHSHGFSKHSAGRESHGRK